MVSVVELREYLDFAAQTAYEAGRLTLGYFQTDTLRTEIKPDDTPVTAADRRQRSSSAPGSRRRIPRPCCRGRRVRGEDASHRWIVDPIDGTKAFVRGVPLYGVLIGLEIEGTCEWAPPTSHPRRDGLCRDRRGLLPQRPPLSGVEHG